MLAQEEADGEVRDTQEETDVPQERAPDRIQEISWIAGHGVARAYGFITLAAAYGCKAELIRGGTHSGRVPLQVAVYGPEGAETADPDERERVLDTVSELYAVLLPEAEKCATEKREAHRKSEAEPLRGYAVNRFSRAVIAGFLQGAAGVLKTEHALKADSYRSGTRARAIDEAAHRTGLSAGRAYAKNTLLPQLQQSQAA